MSTFRGKIPDNWGLLLTNRPSFKARVSTEKISNKLNDLFECRHSLGESVIVKWFLQDSSRES